MLLKNPGFMLAALALNRVMGSLLYEVKPSDPITYLGVSGLLLAAALLACWLPVRRATKVDPSSCCAMNEQNPDSTFSAREIASRHLWTSPGSTA